MAKAGRPTKLTPELHGEIVRTIKAGNYIETAAAMAGVNRDTLREWVRQGIRHPAGKYGSFASDVEQAMAHSEVMDVLGIRKAGEREWTARAWLLERRYPDRWGKRGAEVTINLVQTPQWQELKAKIVTALEPYPEAAAAVARALSGGDVIEVKALPGAGD
jgi:hypothetical protein